MEQVEIELTEIRKSGGPRNDELEGKSVQCLDIENIVISVDDIRSKLANSIEKSSKEYVDAMKVILPKLPPINVRLKNINYSVKVPKSESQRYKIPGMLDGCISVYSNLFCKSTKDKQILRNINLNLTSGTSYLLMGPPASGTSSLLKLLNGNFSRKSISGDIECNGKSIYNQYWKNMASYCGQLDVNHPLFTVEETFQFVIECVFGELNFKDLGYVDLDEAIAFKVKAFEYLLGLNICKDTIVGNEVIRGCSGGEKKRVNVCESILGQSRLFLLDKISTGLDSAVTFDICKFLTYWTKEMNGIMVCHLTQPDPQVIDLFDKVIIMEAGSIIYCNSSKNVLNYFSNLNCELSEGRDFGSFISEMGHMDGRKEYIKDVKQPIKTTQEMIESYENTEEYKMMIKDSKEDAPCSEIVSEYEKRVFETRHSHSYLYIMKVLILRQMKLVYRNRTYIINRLFQDFLMSCLLGWIFSFNENFIVKFGFLNFMIQSVIGNVQPGVINLFKQKDVMYRQLKQEYFSPSSFVVAINFSEYPLYLLDTLIIGVLIYSIGGLTWDDYGLHFLYFLLTMYVLIVTYCSYFKLYAYALYNLSTLQAILPFINFTLVSFSGFGITKNKIPKPLLFLYYLSPMQYGLKNLALNEFLSPKYGDIYPGTNLTRGQVYLKQYEFPIDDSSFGWNFLILLVEHVVCIGLQGLIVAYIFYDPYPPSVSVDKKQIPVLTEEEQEKKLSRASSTINELPFKKACFTFNQVNYFVPVRDQKTGKMFDKQLLNGVSGFAKPYTMTALMGASGAGKTTLLDVLANRKTQGKIEGKFLINGSPYTMNDLCRISGYVEQEDTLPTSETVKEALMVSARLRIGNKVSLGSIEKFVHEMISLLELEDYENLMIGRPGSGLPIGIRKLVMVGIELVANPAIIFLDEPTTGLDSSAALLVCQVLQRIAATGRSIVCTIHQPSEEVFSLFTDILLLERGGKVVYFGESAKGQNMIDYFQSLPGIVPKGADINPATWMLDIIGAGVQMNKDIAFNAAYKSSALYSLNSDELENLENDSSNAYHLDQSYSSSFGTQCKVLTERTLRTSYRRLDYNLKRFQVAFFMALVLGFIYFQVDSSDQAGVQSKFSSLFSTTLFLGMNNIFGNIPILLDNRIVFYRETSMRTYSPIAQLFATAVVEIIYTFFLTLMFHTIIYFLIGFKLDAAAFCIHIVQSFLWILFCVYTGQCVAYAVPTVEVGMLFANFFILLWNVIAGFLIPYPSLKQPWKSIYWASPTMYVLQSMVANQYKGDYSVIHNVPFGDTLIPVITLHDYFAKIMGIRYDQVLYDFIAIIGFIFLMLFATGVIMEKVKYVTR